MNALFVSQIHLKSIIFFAYSLWIHYLFRDFTRNSSYFSRIHYLIHKFSMNSLFSLTSLSVSQIHLESIFLPNHYELTICFAFHYEYTYFFSRIHHLLREFTLIYYLFLRNHYKFAMKYLRIHYFLHDFTENSSFLP